MSDTPVNESQSVNNSAPVNESSAPAQTTTSNPDTGTAAIVHLLAIFTSFVGPLIMYLIYKDKPETSAFLRSHIMNCLNFQLIAGLASIVATFTIVFSFLTLIIWPIAVILEVIALLAANQNKEYKYPIDVQLVK
jgi:uncharacterized Tic20 family protein